MPPERHVLSAIQLPLAGSICYIPELGIRNWYAGAPAPDRQARLRATIEKNEHSFAMGMVVAAEPSPKQMTAFFTRMSKKIS